MPSILNKAFSLLHDFPSLSPVQQQRRIAAINRLLSTAEQTNRAASLALREIDQLRKQRAYMLFTSGRVEEGIREIRSIVDYNETSIEQLHDESAFQLAEGALALFRSNRRSRATAFARLALNHAGKAKRVNRKVLMALELMQRTQEKHKDHSTG